MFVGSVPFVGGGWTEVFTGSLCIGDKVKFLNCVQILGFSSSLVSWEGMTDEFWDGTVGSVDGTSVGSDATASWDGTTASWDGTVGSGTASWEGTTDVSWDGTVGSVDVTSVGSDMTSSWEGMTDESWDGRDVSWDCSIDGSVGSWEGTTDAKFGIDWFLVSGL